MTGPGTRQKLTGAKIWTNDVELELQAKAVADIYANNLVTEVCEACASGQAYITDANDSDFLHLKIPHVIVLCVLDCSATDGRHNCIWENYYSYTDVKNALILPLTRKAWNTKLHKTGKN